MSDDRDRDDRKRDEDFPDALDAIGDALKDLSSDDSKSKTESEIGPKRPRAIRMIEVDRIEHHPDSRELDDASVDQYVAYIKRFGAVDPIQVIERDRIACAASTNGTPSGRYVIVPGKGRHRFEAQRRLGAKRVAAVVESGDANLVIDAALASETMSNREVDVWEQFQSTVRWQDRHPLDSPTEIAEALGLSVHRVSTILTVHEYVYPEIVREKLSANPDRVTLSHLLELSRTGRDETPLRRRDAQLKEWTRRDHENWKPRVKRVRRLRRSQMRLIISRIQPDAYYLGSRVQKWLARCIPEPVEDAIKNAPVPPKGKSRRTIGSQLFGDLIPDRRKK